MRLTAFAGLNARLARAVRTGCCCGLQGLGINLGQAPLQVLHGLGGA